MSNSNCTKNKNTTASYNIATHEVIEIGETLESLTNEGLESCVNDYSLNYVDESSIESVRESISEIVDNCIPKYNYTTNYIAFNESSKLNTYVSDVTDLRLTFDSLASFNNAIIGEYLSDSIHTGFNDIEDDILELITANDKLLTDLDVWELDDDDPLNVDETCTVGELKDLLQEKFINDCLELI